MPLGKYYCDYCDKQFQDTPVARRRHLQSAAHQRAKALWYDSHRSSQWFEDPQQGTAKGGVCNRFVRTGSCHYGDSCKYYHPIKTGANFIINTTPGREGTSGANNASSFQHGEGSLPSGVPFGNHMGIALRNLPPSLWPPPEGGYPPLPFVDWG